MVCQGLATFRPTSMCHVLWITQHGWAQAMSRCLGATAFCLEKTMKPSADKRCKTVDLLVCLHSILVNLTKKLQASVLDLHVLCRAHACAGCTASSRPSQLDAMSVLAECRSIASPAISMSQAPVFWYALEGAPGSQIRPLMSPMPQTQHPATSKPKHIKIL